MAISGALVSTAVMGLLLVGAAVVIARIQRRSIGTSTLGSRRDSAVEVADSPLESDTLALAVAGVLVVFAAAAVYLDAGTLLAVAVAAALLAGFFAWGVYNVARARGLPQAHSVGLSAWMFTVVLVAIIAVKLLVE